MFTIRLPQAVRRELDKVAGECAAIVTGDQDLLILDPFRGIRVLAPSAFWKWESTHDEH
jgi:uncharacterized protein